MMKIKFPVCLVLLCTLIGCQSKPQQSLALLPEAAFDSIVEAKPVALYTLRNRNGITMQVTNYGARVVAIWTPDNDGHWADIVAGRPTLKGYISGAGERFLGAAIGRYANRIADGKFVLDSKAYQLSTYSDGQCLHGGIKGFDRVVWDVMSKSDSEIVLTYLSRDMEEGFPGNGRIEDHLLYINADTFTPLNEKLIPLGTYQKVAGTPFDFRSPTAIGKRINEQNTQLEQSKGYDQNFVLNRTALDDVELAAIVEDTVSGRFIRVYTTEPGLQFYSGNFSDGSVMGKNGKPHTFRSSFAIEVQHFPDSPNQKNFPSTILKPGDTYHQICIYQFGTKKKTYS